MNTKKNSDSFSPPSHFMSAKHERMFELGFGKNYQYDSDFSDSCSGQNYFWYQLKPVEFFKPVDRGFERKKNIIQQLGENWR